MFGPTGRGKTEAAAAIYCGWSRNPIWRDTSAILDTIVDCRRSQSGCLIQDRGGVVVEVWERTEKEKFANASLAVLDDVGVRDATPAAYKILLDLVNSRKQKTTIYTSNLSPADLQRLYDARIVSRMCSGTCIQFSGPDRRMASVKCVTVD